MTTVPDEIVHNSRAVTDGLKKMYVSKIKPLEKKYLFDEFHSPLLSEADFDAKPTVLMIGQYSVGKTSFIEYLLGQKFPGARVGPEPTTDRFMAVMYGDDERIVPGNALAVSPDLPYGGLSMFGTSFLNKFEASQLPCKQLEHMTVIDTPGILSGEKQRISRGYDFVQVAKWFAERADMILLLFDAHKLDISDEFQRVIEVLKGHDDKIRCVLNKSDQIDQQKLMRVYGALMWSMGKVMKTPEVMRVFIGSFWDQPLLYNDNAALFEKERNDLMTELRKLPQNAAIRKVNELVKRVRLAKVHAYLIGHLKDQMPMMIGKDRKQQELIAALPQVFREVQKKYNLPPGDFPNLEEFQKKLEERKIDSFSKLTLKMIQDVEELMSRDIPKLMMALPKKDGTNVRTDSSDSINPFLSKALDWVVTPFKEEYDAIFRTLSVNSMGEASGMACMTPLLATGCSQELLKIIWDLADVDKDGFLDNEEFALAMYLCHQVKDAKETGFVLPKELSENMYPPSHLSRK
ncbi:hypothetical protein THRCLA_06008 [Thraustotheca clavata]|uniref:Uncharacterized protein n=1 Tax=Thraustotheca clavata TaxID=74557 RepID=A0A1V9ZQQ0_9STRA|nr:hypothetical protein THRCLA_06008 [Thraustotheca clavata]